MTLDVRPARNAVGRMTAWSVGDWVYFASPDRPDEILYGQVVRVAASGRNPNFIVGVRISDGRATYVEVDGTLLYEDQDRYIR